MPEVNVATVIRSARVKKGLSQKQVADTVGVTQQAYASWETGRTRPALRNIPALASTLRIARGTLNDAARRA